MENLKGFMISIIITSVILQTGNVFLKSTKYVEFYKFVSSLIMIFVMILPLFGLFDPGETDYADNINYDYSDMSISAVFCHDVAEMIQNDISAEFNVECTVNIDTDMTAITVNVQGAFNTSDENDILNYIKRKYCTSNDEVIIENYA